MSHRISRRTFVFGTAITAAALPARRSYAASDKLRIAAVGCGGQAAADLRAMKREDLVALCDVDAKRASDVFNALPDAPKYTDYREMLEKEQNNIDAVLVAVPDHMHAPAALMAMEMGKHVYVEKPMAHCINDCRRMGKMAKEKGIVTQMGNQGHSWRGVYELTEMVEKGWIGDVKEVHCWTNRPTWPQGIERPTETPPIPETLAWNNWLGPANERPYHPAYCPRDWRGWWDFGCGALGDMGCHILDASYSSLKLEIPTVITAEQSDHMKETGPKSSVITMKYPARGDMPPVTITWHDGGNLPDWPDSIGEDVELGDGDGGTLMIGSKAMVTCGTYGTRPTILDADMAAAWEEEVGDRRGDYINDNHQRNWIEACKEGKKANSDFTYAAPFTEMVLLGNLTLRTGEPIEYDPAKMKVTSSEKANGFLADPQREGWEY